MTNPRAGIRTRREGWARQVRVALTDRDIEIFLLLWTCGVLRTCDIVRLFFGSRPTATDRMRKLHCDGSVECHTRDLTDDNYYTLTPRGRDLVLEYYDLAPDAYRLVRRLPAKLDHLSAVNELRVSLLLACRTNPSYALDAFLTDADLAAERHRALLDLIPDAKIVVRTTATGELHALFLEMDLGTEAVTWLVRHKFATYARHAQLGTALYGIQNPLVVFVTTGLRRARNIARALQAARVDVRVVFALRSLTNETNVLAAAYAFPSDLVAAAPDARDRDVFSRRLLP